MPREVVNENRSKSVKCITIPKKMEWDFPTIGFISRKWINIILRGHLAQTCIPVPEHMAAVGTSNSSLLMASHVTPPLASEQVHHSMLEKGPNPNCPWPSTPRCLHSPGREARGTTAQMPAATDEPKYLLHPLRAM